ncbi:MAG: ATP-grasp domain-containing protein [Jatrophihabitantaceae bacterium]
MLRRNSTGRPLHVIGSHIDPDSPVLRACDEGFPEPELNPDAYVHWALAFARTHGVDVLVPRLHMDVLADAREQFARIGTRLMCADGDTVRLFADKAAAYRAASELMLPVPPFHVAVGSAALRDAYAHLADGGQPVCVKPTHGAGGAGYRVLTTAAVELDELLGRVRSRADLDSYCAALDRAEHDGLQLPELLVLPYLTGPELSIDVLATEAGSMLAAIGRGRSLRRRLLIDDPAAVEVARTLVSAHRVAFLSNVQVRYWQAPGDAVPRPYLLEVNTRISGGLFQTALAGVNLPWDAVRLILGEQVERPHPVFGAAFTTVASLVELG